MICSEIDMNHSLNSLVIPRFHPDSVDAESRLPLLVAPQISLTNLTTMGWLTNREVTSVEEPTDQWYSSDDQWWYMVFYAHPLPFPKRTLLFGTHDPWGTQVAMFRQLRLLVTTCMASVGALFWSPGSEVFHVFFFLLARQLESISSGLF